MRKTAIAAMIALGALVAPVAHAATFVSVWDYSVGTTFAGATFTSGTLNSTVTASEISWGADLNGVAAGNGTLALGVERSGIQIEGTQPQIGQMTTGSVIPQLSAVFSHTNNVLSSSFATLRTASIASSLTLTPNTPSAGSLPAQTINFLVNFAETPNQAGTCVAGAGSVCDDVFVITSGNLNQSFTYDGYTYFASIVPMGANPLNSLPPATCAVAGASSPCLGFLTRENAKTTAPFGIFITARPVTINVPEPGVLALVGLGLAGMGLVSRRRRQA